MKKSIVTSQMLVLRKERELLDSSVLTLTVSRMHRRSTNVVSAILNRRVAGQLLTLVCVRIHDSSFIYTVESVRAMSFRGRRLNGDILWGQPPGCGSFACPCS